MKPPTQISWIQDVGNFLRHPQYIDRYRLKMDAAGFVVDRKNV